jgi:predicted Zn-dependent protease
LRVLPSPAVADPSVVPVLHRYAFALLRRVEPSLTATDREDWWEPMMRSMREYRVSRLVLVLKSPVVERFSSLDRVQLLETYLQAFEDLDQFPNLPSFWVPASRACQMIVDDPDATGPVLSRLGELQLGLLDVLDRLIREEKVEEAKELTADLEERLDATWKRVREKEPKNPRAFIGLARVRARQQRIPEAVKLIEEGRREAGDSSELLIEQARLLQEVSPQAALEETEKAVRGSTKVEDWYLYFRIALRAARPDKAMAACREARKLDPKLVWAATYDAEQSLSRGSHADALEALAPVRSLVPRNPEVARLYARAFVKARAELPLQSLLTEIDFDAWPPPAAAALLAELLSPDRQEYLLPRIDRLAERASEVREVRALQADVYRQAAEPRSGAEWDRKRLEIALTALRWLREKEPNNLQVVNALCFLQLKALRTPDFALRTAEPLKQAHDAGKLPPPMQLTLGAIYLNVGRLDDARRILESAAPRTNTAAGWIDLGLTCSRLNRTDEAKAYLQKAASLPRLPRETEELNQALKLVEGK